MEMEINALLVDDEEQCVKTLQESIDWKALGIARNFGAYNAVQAREIMEKNHFSDPLRYRNAGRKWAGVYFQCKRKGRFSMNET